MELKLDEVNVRIFLSILKPLYAGWMVELQNRMTLVKRRDIIACAFRAVEIINTINLGTKNVPIVNRFHKTDPLLLEVKETNILLSIFLSSEEEKKTGYLPEEGSGKRD